MTRPIEQYLLRYAERSPVPALTRRYRYALTIPAFDEPPGFAQAALADAGTDETLTIVTVNVPEHADPAAYERTRELAASLRGVPDVVVIDRVDNPIPRRRGVGLARKLAADLALALIDRGAIDCPIIFMTDADAILPPGYFEAAARVIGGSAPDESRGTVLYPFRHASTDPRLQSAGSLYELHLRHYQAGLQAAGSPFAFSTLGSTIAMGASTYAAVRGIPRRNAAEDFYLLNKAAKVDAITSLARPRLTLAARLSARVPFGTGPALAAMPVDVESFVSYHPEVFRCLGEVLSSFAAWGLGDEPLVMDDQCQLALAELGWNSERFEGRYPPGSRRWRGAMEWFDGFRTMRFVRLLQARWPDLPLLALWREALGLAAADAECLLRELRSAETERHTGLAMGPAA